MSDVNTITTRPVYLHFLDRELGHSVGFQLSPTVLERSLKCLLLGSASVLYCGISVIWENNNIGQDSLRVLAALTEADALQPVSYKGSLDEFLGSRQRLYRHDAERYPLYFGRNQDYLYSIRPSLHKKDDTTNSLQESLLVWSSHQGRSSNEFEKLAQRVVLSSLLTRDEQAITFSYFATGMRHDGIVAEAEGELRRRISYAYTEHYLDFVNGDIATGVKGLSYFDEQLTRDFPAMRSADPGPSAAQYWARESTAGSVGGSRRLVVGVPAVASYWTTSTTGAEHRRYPANAA